MKTCMCIIAFWCCCLLAIAQTKYEVTANTFLNIRSYASASAPVLGTIDKGGKWKCTKSRMGGQKFVMMRDMPM